jgi:hypothetical protein
MIIPEDNSVEPKSSDCEAPTEVVNDGLPPGYTLGLPGPTLLRADCYLQARKRARLRFGLACLRVLLLLVAVCVMGTILAYLRMEQRDAERSETILRVRTKIINVPPAPVFSDTPQPPLPDERLGLGDCSYSLDWFHGGKPMRDHQGQIINYESGYDFAVPVNSTKKLMFNTPRDGSIVGEIVFVEPDNDSDWFDDIRIHFFARHESRSALATLAWCRNEYEPQSHNISIYVRSFLFFSEPATRS